MAKGKTCFVISPIGEPDTDIRERADLVLEHIIERALETFDYKVIRADKISKPGMITHQVLEHVINDELVIADLTGSNANVFYELAVRHAIRKPLVQIMQDGETLPFDMHGSRTIFVDHKHLGSAERARVEIGEQVKALEADPSTMTTPLSMTIAVQQLGRSGSTSNEKILYAMASSIAGLTQAMGDSKAQISRIEAAVLSPALGLGLTGSGQVGAIGQFLGKSMLADIALGKTPSPFPEASNPFLASPTAVSGGTPHPVKSISLVELAKGTKETGQDNDQ